MDQKIYAATDPDSIPPAEVPAPGPPINDPPPDPEAPPLTPPAPGPINPVAHFSGLGMFRQG